MYRRFSIYTKLLTIYFLVAMLFPTLVFARAGQFELNCPYWLMLFDSAGYMDITFWYPSSRHPFAAHEMMTGDWAAAVSYSGLNETNTAEWLTDSFIIPSFSTGSSFTFGSHSVSNDPNNPVWTDVGQPSGYVPGSNSYSIGSTGNDTGWSEIDDDKLEITIHYEVVDLEPNNWSPISFIDNNGTAYAKSERYVILQTYVFRNIHATENISDLEFYQMLHGHPGTPGAYSLETSGSYDTTPFVDDLENYTPFDSNHQTGNFRYDITLWNTVDSQEGHFDWIGFSSTVEPNDYGFNYFNAKDTYMGSDIKNRDLNNLAEFSSSTSIKDIAGTMMWNLPDLEPNETTFITFALMYGHGEPSNSGLWVEKYDNIDPNEVCGVDPTSGDPNDYKITYTINYGNDGDETAYNCVLTDYLPSGTTYPKGTSTIGPGFTVIPADPNYAAVDHSYTWQIGTLEPDDSGTKYLTITVNTAEPSGELINTAILTSDVGWVRAEETTPVCCFGGSIIYVDDTAAGANTGLNWNNAYNDLQDALTRAAECTTTEIWVTSGIYMPDVENGDRNISFELIDDVEIYGGFNGTETSRSERDFLINKTVLSGDIDSDGNSDTNKVVHADSTITSSAVLDGFIITDGYDGIYCDSGDPTVKNCVIADNHDDGVYCTGSNIAISWSIIKDNGGDGVECYGSGKTPSITNSKIRDNDDHGLYSQYSVPSVKNNWIHHNGADNSGYGIYLTSPSAAATIRTNTIAHNSDEGVYRNTSGTTPAISDCIIWQNNSDDNYTQLTNCSATYSCITDPNDVNGTATGADTPDGDDNISANPDFAYSDPSLNNYHLDSDSPCIDKGNPSGTYTGEKDIDTDTRVYNSRVDMGADEVSCTDVSSIADFNGDGLVNNLEFAMISIAWLSHDPNEYTSDDPNDFVGWNSQCDLNTDYVVDVNDLVIFADDWCWEACYRSAAEGTLMEMMGMMSMSYSTLTSTALEPVATMSLGVGDAFIVDDVADQLVKAQKQFRSDQLIEARNQRAYDATHQPPTTEDKIEQAENGLDFLNEVKEDEELKETIDLDNLQRVIDSLEDQIEELKDSL